MSLTCGCGAPIARSGKRGRQPHYCEECRAARNREVCKLANRKRRKLAREKLATPPAEDAELVQVYAEIAAAGDAGLRVPDVLCHFKRGERDGADGLLLRFERAGFLLWEDGERVGAFGRVKE